MVNRAEECKTAEQVAKRAVNPRIELCNCTEHPAWMEVRSKTADGCSEQIKSRKYLGEGARDVRGATGLLSCRPMRPIG